MTETWQQRLQREAREVHAAVDAFMAAGTGDAQLREKLEQAAQLPQFNATSWRWGEWLWRAQLADTRLRVALRPFLLAHLSAWGVDEKGRDVKLWTANTETWLADADAAADVEIFRELLEWKLRTQVWRDRSAVWRRLLLEKLAAARDAKSRAAVLQRFEVWAELDEATALTVYDACGDTARRFILNRLPWQGDLWEKLHTQALRLRDEETAWTLYRRQVKQQRWAADVQHLITTVADAETLQAELEKRHPQHVESAGDVFVTLAKQRGVHALPYLQRHVRAVFPRWGWYGRKDGGALKELVRLADTNAWTALWARLLQSSATPELWNEWVQQLLDAGATTLTARTKLQLLAGAGGEWNFSGFSLAQVQPLSDEVALLMYERAPELLRGPFRMHLSLDGHSRSYPKLLARVLGADDEVLADFLASRAVLVQWNPGAVVKQLGAHYERMSPDDGTFVRRATQVLSMLPAYAIWSYENLLKQNPLARLLFERSTALYLADGRLVRELLESPQIHVQALAFRVLATKDPRAGVIAAANVDVLAPVLLRAMHRRTRTPAFSALEAACLIDEVAAAVLLPKMREALTLPDKRYPKDALVSVIGRVLAKWPTLRTPTETPRVFRRSAA